MTIFLNGEQVDCGDARTVDELIQRQRLPLAATLVECNGTALHRRDWPAQTLRENDRLEIMQVAAGG